MGMETPTRERGIACMPSTILAKLDGRTGRRCCHYWGCCRRHEARGETMKRSIWAIRPAFYRSVICNTTGRSHMTPSSLDFFPSSTYLISIPYTSRSPCYARPLGRLVGLHMHMHAGSTPHSVCWYRCMGLLHIQFLWRERAYKSLYCFQHKHQNFLFNPDAI